MSKITVKLVVYVFAAILLILGGVLLFAGYTSANHWKIVAGWSLDGIGLVIWVGGYLVVRYLVNPKKSKNNTS